MYLCGTTSAETFKPFLFHVVMMFVLPILAFFFSRDQLASRGYSDKDQNIYAGFISIFFVLLVIGSYILRIIADQDNWTPTTNQQKPVPKTTETKIPKQPVQVEKSQIQETKNTKKDKSKPSSTQEKNTNKPETKKNQEKENQPQPQSVANVTKTKTKENKENNEGVTKRDVKQNKEKTPTASAAQKKNTSKKGEKVAKPEPKEQPKPANKKKTKSNNPFDYII